MTMEEFDAYGQERGVLGNGLTGIAQIAEMPSKTKTRFRSKPSQGNRTPDTPGATTPGPMGAPATLCGRATQARGGKSDR